MVESNEIDRRALVHKARHARRDQLKLMKMSRWSDWLWAAEGYEDAVDWLLSHPKNIRKGTYLSYSSFKEVWRYTLPAGFGGETIIYKYFDYNRKSLGTRLKLSMATSEALNSVALREMGISVADVLACGENRHVGFLSGAFLITRCIPDSLDGSALMPKGSLRDKDRLRFGFAKNAMEGIAKAHLCGCFHSEFHAHKMLFPMVCDEDNPQVTWIDVAKCQFSPDISMKRAILLDLVRFFVDLRLSNNEIKKLCNHYLQFNPNCGYSVPTLWEAMTELKPI